MRIVYNKETDDEDTVEADDEADDEDKKETKDKDKPIETEEKARATKAPKGDKKGKEKEEIQTKEKKKGPLGITTVVWKYRRGVTGLLGFKKICNITVWYILTYTTFSRTLYQLTIYTIV